MTFFTLKLLKMLAIQIFFTLFVKHCLMGYPESLGTSREHWLNMPRGRWPQVPSIGLNFETLHWGMKYYRTRRKTIYNQSTNILKDDRSITVKLDGIFQITWIKNILYEFFLWYIMLIKIQYCHKIFFWKKKYFSSCEWSLFLSLGELR